jgi:hypothetical protein
MMKPQQSYDYIVRSLRQQGRKSADAQSGECMYRGPDGLKCAAGHVIPEDKYEARFEGKTVLEQEQLAHFSEFDSPAYDLSMLILDEGHYLNLVRRLQIVHDGCFQNWEQGFQETAEEFGLKYTPPYLTTAETVVE